MTNTALETGRKVKEKWELAEKEWDKLREKEDSTERRNAEKAWIAARNEWLMTKSIN